MFSIIVILKHIEFESQTEHDSAKHDAQYQPDDHQPPTSAMHQDEDTAVLGKIAEDTHRWRSYAAISRENGDHRTWLLIGTSTASARLSLTQARNLSLRL